MNNQKERGSAVGAILGTAIVAIVGVVGGWIAHDMYARRAKAAGENARAPQKAAMGPQTVAIETVTEKPYNLPRTYVAHVEAMQEVELQPQVDGYIKQIFFKEGDLVKEGQLLYQLDD